MPAGELVIKGSACKCALLHAVSACIIPCSFPGYGSIEYRPEDTTRPDVYGVVLDLTQEEMKSLANTEQGYDVVPVVVTGPDGRRFSCKAFSSNWSVRLFQETLPTEDYIGKLQEGSKIHELPAEYQVRCYMLQQRPHVSKLLSMHESDTRCH